MDKHSAHRGGGPLAGGVVWLHDPGADGAGGLDPLVWTPGSLSQLLATTLADVGLDELELTGVVSGLQRRRVCSFELVEHRARAGCRMLGCGS